MKAGTAVIINHSLIHYSPPNLSKNVRKAIIAGYTNKGAQMYFYYKKPNKNIVDIYKITNDIYDDLRIEIDQDNNLYFNSNRDTGIILSNKLENIFPTKNLKLYQLKLDKNDISTNSISSEGNVLQFN